MDLSKLNINGMPIFYQNVFKVWKMFKVQREEHFKSLHWLLEEPLIYGARFDLAYNDCTFPGLTETLVASKICTMGSLVNLTGPDFVNMERVAMSLKIKSRRFVFLVLEKWKERLTSDELKLLSDYCEGKSVPNERDVLSDFFLLPVLDDVSGMFLRSGKSLSLNFFF